MMTVGSFGLLLPDARLPSPKEPAFGFSAEPPVPEEADS